MIEFKQFGIVEIQELVTLPVENGDIMFEHMCPPGKFVFDDDNAPWILDPNMDQEDINSLMWYPPKVIPLFKTEKPEDVEGMVWVPKLSWFPDYVERQWEMKDEVLSFAQQVAKSRTKMASILESLSVEHQAMLFSTRIAVEDAFDRGRLDIAYTLIATQEIPEELEYAKSAIIALFPSVNTSNG